MEYRSRGAFRRVSLNYVHVDPLRLIRSCRYASGGRSHERVVLGGRFRHARNLWRWSMFRARRFIYWHRLEGAIFARMRSSWQQAG